MTQKYRSAALSRDLDTADLSGLSGPDLVALHRELTQENVTKFRDRATGVARVTPHLERAIAAITPSRPSTGFAKRPRTPYNYPYQGGEIQKCRPGTKRGKLVEIFSTPEGATFEEAAAATQWPYKVLQENVRLLWSHVGWGLEENPVTGKIRVVGPTT